MHTRSWLDAGIIVVPGPWDHWMAEEVTASQGEFLQLWLIWWLRGRRGWLRREEVDAEQPWPPSLDPEYQPHLSQLQLH